ncbi:MAG TPA: hypothetical protein VGG35_26505 [Streptosporangiaceae bacterium]|jgi:hypothetical protein
MTEVSELRDGYAEIGDQRLHYVEAGEGPLIVSRTASRPMTSGS